ncbi:hypothetical protein ACSBQ3_10865 [Staphylococcus equorum]|nr:hypothetical protein [Staphylococcus equorum]
MSSDYAIKIVNLKNNDCMSSIIDERNKQIDIVQCIILQVLILLTHVS